MNDYVRRVEEAVGYLLTLRDPWPETAVVLGTGLAGVADLVADVQVVETASIPGFPDQSSRRRSIDLILGTLGGADVAVFDGRLHLYQGYSPRDVTFYVRALGAAGTKTLIECCASGGIALDLKVADIAVVRDQINLTGSNPLEGANHAAWGPRFPDMSRAFSSELIDSALSAAGQSSETLAQGVYAGVGGPSLETAAEYGMLSRIGADLVGMSLIHEVIAARHMGIDVLGLAVVTDLCRSENPEPVSPAAILEAAEQATPRLADLIEAVCKRRRA